MKLLISLLLLSATLFAQNVEYRIIFETKYTTLPFPIRITSSGIYGVEDFNIENNRIEFTTYDREHVYTFTSSENSYTTSHRSLVPAFETAGEETGNRYFTKESYISANSHFIDNGGILTNQAGETISIIAENKSTLRFKTNLITGKSDYSFSLGGDLACADFIGMDKLGNSFILVERFVTQIPLSVKREVWVISENGSLRSKLEVPSIKYLSLARDFRIDAEGNLYHLLTELEGLKIFKWTNLIHSFAKTYTYPPEYNFTLHYNRLLPTEEYVPEVQTEETSLAVNRATALRTADTYVMQKYSCTSANLAPTAITAPGGDIVKTPSWLIVGFNARVPYKWGGFNTIAQFSTGILSNKFAGDIHTDGVSSDAVGVDCSGFVSRCWQRTSHVSTAYMPNISTVLPDWDALKPADGILKSGHVRLFVHKNPNGSLRVVESAARNWDVSYWSFQLSDLTSYNPVLYNQMESSFSFQRPILHSAMAVDTATVEFTLQCDTTNVQGYRLYRSTNFLVWSLVANETVLTDTIFEFPLNKDAAFYRVSSVLKDGSESHWSNVLGVSTYLKTNKILIVDGFERETGNWQGAGNPFVFRYGKALVQDQYRFESIKKSRLPQINHNNYFAVIWFTGDQSTADETFSDSEQTMVKAYLESGGNLFANGSEIGWDLYNKGTSADKLFFNNYLKAAYINDNASAKIVNGETGSPFSGESFNFGQTYVVNSPDEISINGGSSVAFRYSNNKIAGIHYSGTFGTSQKAGKVIYFGFPLETTASDASFNSVMRKVMEYFLIPTDINEAGQTPIAFELAQNYPNPFNPVTRIEYKVADAGNVKIEVFDILGNKVTELINTGHEAGSHHIDFNAAGFASGVYYYKITAPGFTRTMKMMLLK
ncbi:MAG TPA: T9SS type A sorting domain-containing protein [Ignavibacteriaceae bacterium]|nr:T9SS type A sorting domain-containing protein [Ignavibacteriaceae bacterium]